MTWYAVYRVADGALVSVGDTLANPLPAGLAFTDLGPNPPTGVWNTVTHVFDAAAALKAVLSLRDFWGRFTQAERETLWNIRQNGTATQKQKLGAFKDYLTDCGCADLNDAYVQTVVNLMETAGVLAAGRAAVILS